MVGALVRGLLFKMDFLHVIANGIFVCTLPAHSLVCFIKHVEAKNTVCESTQAHQRHMVACSSDRMTQWQRDLLLICKRSQYGSKQSLQVLLRRAPCVCWCVFLWVPSVVRTSTMLDTDSPILRQAHVSSARSGPHFARPCDSQTRKPSLLDAKTYLIRKLTRDSSASSHTRPKDVPLDSDHPQGEPLRVTIGAMKDL